MTDVIGMTTVGQRAQAPVSGEPPELALIELLFFAYRDFVSDPDALLADYGLPVVEERPASTLEEASAAASEIGFPVVLKTAARGVQHKSDVGGVRLGLTDLEDVREAYDDVAARLGPHVAVAAAAPELPSALYEQLAPAGRIVIPVGRRRAQRLELVVRSPEGPAVLRSVPCRFVPLLGAEGFAE